MPCAKPAESVRSAARAESVASAKPAESVPSPKPAESVASAKPVGYVASNAPAGYVPFVPPADSIASAAIVALPAAAPSPLLSSANDEEVSAVESAMHSGDSDSTLTAAMLAWRQRCDAVLATAVDTCSRQVRSASSSEAGESDRLAALSEPLLDSAAPPSLLGTDRLSQRQRRLDQRLRTLCQVTLSSAVTLYSLLT